jgi:hypothetical protein
MGVDLLVVKKVFCYIMNLTSPKLLYQRRGLKSYYWGNFEMHEILVAILVWVAVTFGYTEDTIKELPGIDVQSASMEKIREVHCPGQQCVRPTAWDGKVLYILKGYNFAADPIALSFIAHDIVHHVQLHKYYNDDYEAFKKNEEKNHEHANVLQRKFLHELGIERDAEGTKINYYGK